MLFTSGSTGTPKGVVVSHGNVTHRLASYLALSEGPCRYLLHSSLCFDGAVGGMFSTLARGGCLVLVPDAVAGDPGLAAHAVRAERITHLEPVPSWYATLLEVAAAGDLDSVRVVILGGEVLPPELVAASRRALPAARLFNDYGPTEVTVAATVHEISPEWSGAGVPIGRPHANTVVAVLDEEQRPVPAGEVGELWVGGPCVAQGYLGLPDHPSFQPDPATGGRRYRTGDLVRWDDDGFLRFCGRRDRQVKIRGQRIEPEEVEAVLGGLPGVAGSAVEVDADGPEARLVAYVSPVPGTELAPETVSQALAERLPAHLRPAVVVVLPALPLTAGGKVDRRALPAVSRRSTSADAGEAPRDHHEQLVAEAFGHVLGTDADRGTDFFAAGGQSLGAARVVARLRAELGVEVGLADLAARPTPAALAAVLRERPPVAAEEQLRRRERPADQEWRVPASPRQASFWYLEHVPAGQGRSNLVEVLTFPRGTDPVLLGRAVEALVERHAALRTAFELQPDGLYQVVLPQARPHVVDLPAAPDAAALDGLADAFGADPFDLSRAPLVRAARVAGPDGPALVLVVHHAVADGWSLNVLVEELAAVVRAGGDVSGLPDPEVEFVDLVEWTADRTPARRAAAVDHFTPRMLRGAESADRMLPFDRPASPHPDPRVSVVRAQLPEATLRRVTELARTLGTTTYSVLSSSLGALLAQTAGQPGVLLTGPLSGRGEPALDRVVGCCINTRLIPVDVSGEPTFAQLVHRVAAEAAAGEPHEWMPLEIAMRELPEGVRVGVGPVLFNFLEPQSGDLSLGGGAPSRRSRPAAMAYSELDVYLEHRDGGLSVECVHLLQRLDRETVEHLVERWIGLLESALDDPDQPVAALPLVTDAEAARLDALEGAPGRSVPGSVLDEIRARTSEDPEAVAVIDRDGRWTRASCGAGACIADLLEQYGVRPGGTVVLALDETADALAALVACWRSGVVPVPVGEGQPQTRMDAVAAAAGATLVLDHAVLRAAARVAGPAGRSRRPPTARPTSCSRPGARVCPRSRRGHPALAASTCAAWRRTPTGRRWRSSRTTWRSTPRSASWPGTSRPAARWSWPATTSGSTRSSSPPSSGDTGWASSTSCRRTTGCSWTWPSRRTSPAWRWSRWAARSARPLSSGTSRRPAGHRAGQRVRPDGIHRVGTGAHLHRGRRGRRSRAHRDADPRALPPGSRTRPDSASRRAPRASCSSVGTCSPTATSGTRR